MQYIKSKNTNNNILILAVLKYTILIAIILLNSNKRYIEKNLVDINVMEYLPFFKVAIIPISIGIGFFLRFLFSYIGVKRKSYHNQIIEDSIFIILTSALMILNKNNSSGEYKVMFMVIIISSTISFGKKYGLKIAGISSFIVLGLSLIYNITDITKSYRFENDLFMCVIFGVIAWILGNYVISEQKQIQALEDELEIQLKQHNYIEDMMIQNEACYDLLIKSSSEVIIIHNEKGVLFLNEKALNLFGVNQGDDSANKYEYVIDSGYKKEDKVSNSYYKEILLNKYTNISFEEVIKNSEGEEYVLHNISTYCIYDKQAAILTTMRDITPIKQVQELKEDVKRNVALLNETIEYNRYITDFFSNISHEFKTPLNIIFSSVQLLNIYIENDEPMGISKKKAYLKSMKQNCYRLTRLINNILDVTKLDSGFITLQLQNVDIISYVENITMSVIPYAENKGIELIFDTYVEEKIVAVDPNKIERIMLNLLSNALKFTDTGGKIYVSISNTEDSIIISVKDNGIGIPEDKLELIFERFMQVDKTLRRNHEGTGIGLSLVKSFVELHEGDIQIVSKINEGSEFLVNLPIRLVDNQECIMEREIEGDFIEKVNLELADVYGEVMKETNVE